MTPATARAEASPRCADATGHRALLQSLPSLAVVRCSRKRSPRFVSSSTNLASQAIAGDPTPASEGHFVPNTYSFICIPCLDRLLDLGGHATSSVRSVELSHLRQYSRLLQATRPNRGATPLHSAKPSSQAYKMQGECSLAEGPPCFPSDSGDWRLEPRVVMWSSFAVIQYQSVSHLGSPCAQQRRATFWNVPSRLHFFCKIFSSQLEAGRPSEPTSEPTSEPILCRRRCGSPCTSRDSSLGARFGDRDRER